MGAKIIPNDEPELRLLSLGAGVQSTCVALMIKHGEIPPVDLAIFADTGCEPRPVYRNLEWLCSDADLGFPVHIISAGNLVGEMLGAARNENKSHGRVPLYVPGKSGPGRVRRQCTSEYKIDPINKHTRRWLLGLQKGQRIPKGAWVEGLIGISWDEPQRAKQPREPWRVHSWPLIEMKMTRRDCLLWMKRHGYPEPPRSACTICPNRSDREWRHLRDNDPVGWAEAVEVDEEIRNGMKNLRAENCFLHRSMKPLTKVGLSTPDDWHGGNLFSDECQGMCGL